VFTDKATGKTPSFQASEFSCRDVYQLDIFDRSFAAKKPVECDEADASLPYCQLFGQYRLNVIDYSSIKPYDNMNEKCPNQFESGIRRPYRC